MGFLDIEIPPEAMADLSDYADRVLAPATEPGLEEASELVVDAVVDGVEARFTRRTGSLSDAWANAATEVVEDGGGMSANVNPDHPAARILDTGGQITPAGAYLAVPLTDEARTAGSPRNIGDLFAVRTKADNLLLARALGGGTIEPLYVLKEFVDLPPTNYIQESADAAEQDAQDALDDAYQASIDRDG